MKSLSLFFRISSLLHCHDSSGQHDGLERGTVKEREAEGTAGLPRTPDRAQGLRRSTLPRLHPPLPRVGPGHEDVAQRRAAPRVAPAKAAQAPARRQRQQRRLGRFGRQAGQPVGHAELAEKRQRVGVAHQLADGVAEDEHHRRDPHVGRFGSLGRLGRRAVVGGRFRQGQAVGGHVRHPLEARGLRRDDVGVEHDQAAADILGSATNVTTVGCDFLFLQTEFD